MINIPGYEGHGRRIMVEFTCYRCRVKTYRALVDCLPTDGPAMNLSDYRPPVEWRNGGFYYPMFCPECAEKYDQFMKGTENELA